MAHTTVTWFGRLRIERLVWALDQRLYDLPRHSRIAKRREVRANLLSAAQDIGTGEALRRLGTSRELAGQYLAAEFGEGPRHSWIATAYIGGAAPLLLNFFLDEAASAYSQAVTATDPHATGTFIWHGISYLQSAVTYAFDDGHASRTGGAWTPLTYILWALATVVGGRLWRLPWWKDFRRKDKAAAMPTP